MWRWFRSEFWPEIFCGVFWPCGSTFKRGQSIIWATFVFLNLSIVLLPVETKYDQCERCYMILRYHVRYVIHCYVRYVILCFKNVMQGILWRHFVYNLLLWDAYLGYCFEEDKSSGGILLYNLIRHKMLSLRKWIIVDMWQEDTYTCFQRYTWPGGVLF